MACSSGATFRLKTGPALGISEIAADNDSKREICTATKILERLHKEFTEQYVEPPAAGASVPTGKTRITNDVSMNPTFYLRNQPMLDGFAIGTTREGAADGSKVNRFHKIFTTTAETDEIYRRAVSAILKGDASDTGQTTYMNNIPRILNASDFREPAVFKGLYGLVRVNEILENKIADRVNNLQGEVSSNVLSDALHYEKRKNIKTTLEEIAHRENEIYREKFLNIVLVIVGIFIVSSQLMKDYFSFSGGGGGGSSGSGFGGVGGWLSTRFGSGSGGIFSRFGGLGLGSSGRSRIGNLFTSSPYSTSQRE
jgi:hypothetical protein